MDRNLYFSVSLSSTFCTQKFRREVGGGGGAGLFGLQALRSIGRQVWLEGLRFGVGVEFGDVQSAQASAC